MKIHFTPLGPDCQWNLKMARLIHLLWEVAQLNAINLPLSTSDSDSGREYVTLLDFRMTGKIYMILNSKEVVNFEF